KLICCMAVVLLVGITSFAQRTGNFPPTSGAMLEINGSVGGSPIDVKIYDSQIHSTVVQAVPTANGNGSNCGDGVAFGTTDERVPTDAYVLQGGSPTGCDPGDNFEVTDNNPNTPRQAPGVKANFFGFRIETHYKENTAVSISGATNSGSNTTYNYALTSGPDLVAGETIVTSGMEAGNNGTFVISAVVTGVQFTVNNPAGFTNATEVGTGTV